MLPSTRGIPWRECETGSSAKQTCRLVTESQSRWRHHGLTLQVPRRALPKTFPRPHLLIQSHPSIWGWIQAPQRRGANQSGLLACPEHAPAGQALARSAHLVPKQSITYELRNRGTVPLINGRIPGCIMAEARSLHGYCIFMPRLKRAGLLEGLATKACAEPTFRPVASRLLPSTSGAGLGCTVRPERRHASC